MSDNTGLHNLLLKDSNIPRRYSIPMLSSCNGHCGWAAAFNRARFFVESKTTGNMVVLCGARGTGKTQMACELMRHAASLSYFCRYDVLQDYLDKVRSTWHTADNHAELYQSPRLVVLDEIAKAGDSAWVESRLFHLVNARYNDLKHTVLITAAQPADIEAIVGPSVADRINEGGTVIHLNWPSFRSSTP